MPSLLTVTDEDAARGGSLFRDLSQLPASPERFIEASSEISELQSPSGSIARAMEQAEVTPQERRLRSPRPVAGQSNVVEPEPFEGVMLSAEEANERVQGLGLKPFMEETPEDLVDLLARRKKREIALQSILDRSPGTFTSARGIGAQFLAQVKDPINIASAFIPVVGPTRFAAMAGRFGVTRARAITGLTEGAVGAAVVEPIVLGQALSEQADYGLADAFLNVVFGTVLGGGLHVGGGRSADVVTRLRGGTSLPQRIDALPIQSRERLTRTAVAALAEGRQVDISALLRVEEADLAIRRAIVRGETAATEVPAGAQTAPLDARRTETRQLPPEVRQEIESLGEALRQAEPEVARDIVQPIAERARRIEQEGATPSRRSRAPSRQAIQRVTDKLVRNEALTERDAPLARAIAEDATARQRERSAPTASAGPEAEARAREAVQTEARRRPDEAALSVDRAAASEIETQVSSQPASADLVQSAQEELDEAMERLDAVREATGLGAEETAESFAEFDEGISAAQARGRAARAAALCQVRR